MHKENRPATPEVEGRIAKALVILFPDVRTTGGKSPIDEAYTPILVEDFIEITTKLVRRYQRLGFTTFAIVYRDTDQTNFSRLYPRNLFQNIINWNQTFTDWGQGNQSFHESYQNAIPNLIRNLNLEKNAQVAVGGYHAKDCVALLSAYLENLGFRATIDLRLTDQLPFLLVSHRFRRMLPGAMRKEHREEDSRVWKRIKDEVESLKTALAGK